MRISLYGGCFNPVHTGHMSAARGACAELGLDKVVFIPSGNPPLKGNSGLVAGMHRRTMLELAIADDPKLEVSAIELDRQGPSFTVDTVRALRKQYPSDVAFFFLLGDDCVDRLPHWKGIAELHQTVQFAILPRTGIRPRAMNSQLIWLQTPQVDVSSTQIRTMLATGQRPGPELIPTPVANYVIDHELYAPLTEDAGV